VREGGARTWMEVEGEGDVVVLAGGGPGNGHGHYHPWFSALAERHRVVYFDYLGTGRSDRLERREGYSVERYAEQTGPSASTGWCSATLR
jgi:pimeloyl-ACP methyl ester carboxylesterase